MKTIAPLQLMNLAKSLIIFFLLPSIAWIVANYIAFQGMVTGIILWVVFMGNLMISGLVGWWWYRRTYHTRLSWNDEGFEMQRGKGNKSSKKWRWFEDVVTYANGRVPEALIASSEWLGEESMCQQGLDSLDWLLDVQTDAADGHISLIGNRGWYKRGVRKARFDQQLHLG